MEFEVRKEAVEKYKYYDIYSKWIVSETARRSFCTMPGYYLWCEDYPQCEIVGDVLTSNKVWGNAKDRNNLQIKNLLSLFEKLYHIDGNYIPIPEFKGSPSAQLRGRNCDTYTHHLNICKEAIEGCLEKYDAWQKWAQNIWKPYCDKEGCSKCKYWEKFVFDFYLIDFVDNEMNPISFVVGRSGANQVGIKKENNDEVVIETIRKCIELIIKRDYRINKKKHEQIDWHGNKEYEEYKYNLLKNLGWK
jgi:hypothetical protein